MADHEKRMLEEANALAHANIHRREIAIDLFKYLPSILSSTMETANTYKNATNFLMEIDGEIDFTAYPDSQWETRCLSKLVMEMYQYAWKNLQKSHD